ncbi:MAG TPA: hypothetical protein VFS79_10510 [Arthrobacter sp.]|nr:hypothetical protein [Arthrobacter sp.]
MPLGAMAGNLTTNGRKGPTGQDMPAGTMDGADNESASAQDTAGQGPSATIRRGLSGV